MVIRNLNENLGETHNVAMFDLRGEPILRMWSVKGEQLDQLQVLVVGLDVTPDNRLVLVLQSGHNELLYGYVQESAGRGASPASGNSAGYSAASEQKPDPMQAIQGSWITSDSLAAVQFDGQVYTMYMADGMGGWDMLDSGPFQIHGSMISITDSEGVLVQAQFQINEQQLAIDDGTGVIWFQKVE